MSGSEQHVVIAIDGPAASGKSTVARELAQRLGFIYVNTGAMYRAVTWHVLEKGVAPADAEGVARQMQTLSFQCEFRDAACTILLDGVDPTPFLIAEAVNRNVSAVAGVPEVRRILVQRQRQLLREGNLVMEGRDIGSVVFPDTPYKFYVDASPEVRAQRRAKQGLTDEIRERDRVDASRQASPLRVAEGAEIVDSSHMSIQEVVNEILARLRTKGLASAGPAS